MSGVVRKCKACNFPVKGHQGPTGVGNCKRQLGEGEKMEGGSLGDKYGKIVVEDMGEVLARVEEYESLQRRGGQQEEGQSADEVHGGDVKVKEVKKGVPSKRKIKQGGEAKEVEGEDQAQDKKDKGSQSQDGKEEDKSADEVDGGDAKVQEVKKGVSLKSKIKRGVKAKVGVREDQAQSHKDEGVVSQGSQDEADENKDEVHGRGSKVQKVKEDQSNSRTKKGGGAKVEDQAPSRKGEGLLSQGGQEEEGKRTDKVHAGGAKVSQVMGGVLSKSKTKIGVRSKVGVGEDQAQDQKDEGLHGHGGQQEDEGESTDDVHAGDTKAKKVESSKSKTKKGADLKAKAEAGVKAKPRSKKTESKAVESGKEGVDRTTRVKVKPKSKKTEQNYSVEGEKLASSTDILSSGATSKAQQERRGTFVVAAKYPKDAFEGECGDGTTTPRSFNEVSEKVPDEEIVEDSGEAVDAEDKAAKSPKDTSVTAPGEVLLVVETLQERAAGTPFEESDYVEVADKVEYTDIADKVIGDESVEAPGKADSAGKAEGAGDFGCNNVTSDSDDTEVSHFLPNKKVMELY